MEELIGFVASNSRLGKILAVLDSKGPMDSATIAKTTRIAGAEKNIEEWQGKSWYHLIVGNMFLQNWEQKSAIK